MCEQCCRCCCRGCVARCRCTAQLHWRVIETGSGAWSCMRARHDDVVLAARSVAADSSLGRPRPRPHPPLRQKPASAAADVEPSAAAWQSLKTCTPRATSPPCAGHCAADLLRPGGDDVQRWSSSPLRSADVCRTEHRRSGVWWRQEQADVLANGREHSSQCYSWWLRTRSTIRTSWQDRSNDLLSNRQHLSRLFVLSAEVVRKCKRLL